MVRVNDNLPGGNCGSPKDELSRLSFMVMTPCRLFIQRREANMRNVIPGYILFYRIRLCPGSILFGKVFSGLNERN